MEGLKLQQPTLVGLGTGVAAALGDGGRGAAGGANTQRGASGASGAAGARFAISRTPGSAVRLSQGARLQHEAGSPGRQGSRSRRSGGSGTTARVEGAGDGAAIGDRAGVVVSIVGPGPWTTVLSGAGLGTCEGRRAGAVDGTVAGGVVARRDGLAEGFGEAGLAVADLVGLGVAVGAALVVGLGAVLVVGLGAVLVVGLGAVLVVGLGAALVVGLGAGFVAVPEGAGRGVVLGGFGVVEAVGAVLDVGGAALDDGAGSRSEVGLVSGFRSSGGVVGAALFGAAWDDFGSACGSVPRLSFLGAVLAVVRGASALLGAVLAVVRGASSSGRVLPGGVAVVSALLGRVVPCLSLSRRGDRDRSSGASRGAVLAPVGRSGERGGESSVSGEGCARSRGALRFSVS